MRFDAVVFDCDGVLVDSEPVSYRAWRDALANWGHALTESEFEPSIGTTDWMVAEHWAPRLEATATELDAAARLAFLERVSEIILFEDAVELVHRLDVPIAVGTNSARWRLDAILAATRLDRVFAVTVTSSDVEHPKPAADIYRAAFSRLGVDCQDGLVLEDSRSGIDSASAAGAYVIAVARGGVDEAHLSGADRIVSSLGEVEVA